MNTQNIAEDSKIGKRLAQSQVAQLIDEIETENKAAANWTAKVGETIIGNLARGKGGRFISASNINSMRNQLEKENISPDMFLAMQDLLAGKEISDDVMEQLKVAGLATEDGQASSKTAQIITAMKTGDPAQLKSVLKPSGKGKGKKPGKAPKPSKSEREEANVQDTGKQLVEQGRITEAQLNGLVKFANGETVDNALMQELVNSGLVWINPDGFFSFTTEGNGFYDALQKADLRRALDRLNKAESKAAAKIEKERLEQQENLEGDKLEKDESSRIEEMKNEFVTRSGFDNIDAFVDFAEGGEPTIDFNEIGLTKLDNLGSQITTPNGKKLVTSIKKGNLREALDAYRKALLSVDSAEKNFDIGCNENCFGLKVLQGENDDYLLTLTTNAYEDREKETFTLKSIRDYVDRNIDNEDKGPHLFWHVPGSAFTDLVGQMVSGKFLVEIGRFRKDEVGQAFKEFFIMYPDGHPDIAPDGWGCSHGFVYKKSDREDGVYEWFDKKESTVLPLHEAANVFTLAEFVLGEKSMKLSDKQREAFNIVGEETKQPNFLERILNLGKKRTEVLDKAGVISKQAVLKTEGGDEYPARCYAYVPDKENVSTWKLRMCGVGTTDITRDQLGAASSAFSPGGHRGKKVQLPSEDVSKVKSKIRSEYEKLGVSREDMPESIKAIDTEVKNMDELLEKFKAATESVDGEMREGIDAAMKEDVDHAVMVRQLAELVAQIQDEELRLSLEEIVSAMQELLPVSEDEEEDVNIETENEQEVPEEDEMKLYVDKVAEALKLNELNVLLEKHDTELKAVGGIASAIEELVQKTKELSERLVELESGMSLINEKAVEVEEKTKQLEKDDDEKLAEKEIRFTPFWGDRFQASKAAETVLDEGEQKKYSKPEVPSVVQGMSKRIYRGK